jgi:hypothetical protein
MEKNPARTTFPPERSVQERAWQSGEAKDQEL